MSTKVYDGFSDLRGGMNGNVLSSEVGERQYLKGINITCRGGTIKTRPPFMGIPLSFANFADQRIFEQGKFQGAIDYNAIHQTYLAVAVSGNVFLIEPDTGKVANVSTEVGRLNQMQDRLYFCQVERYLIVQDGVNIPYIIDGTSVALANHTLPSPNQIPVGTIMAYGHGRLFIKVASGEFLCGDINMPTIPTAVLQFVELQTQVSALAIPKDLGDITGMAFVQNFQTGDGQGPLIVFAKKGFDAFAVYTPRSYWTESDISQVQGRGIGCASPTCVVVTGDDIILRTHEGIGSYGLFQKQDRRFVNMSLELQPFEDQETPWCRSLSSGVLFDNRVLFTMVAEKVNALTLEGDDIADYRFKALGSLDLAPMNGLTEIGKGRTAVYDGAWTGPNPTAIVTAGIEEEQRCFVFGKTDEGINVLYELMKKSGDDCGTQQINCRLYPDYMSFLDYAGNGQPRDTIHDMKRLEQANLYINEFEESVKFKLWGRPDRRNRMELLSELEIHSPMVSADPPYTTIATGQSQGRMNIQFPQFKLPSKNEASGSSILSGYQYEFCIEWDGIAELSRVGIVATIQPASAVVPVEKSVVLIRDDRNDFDYTINCPSFETALRKLFASFRIRRGRFDAWILRGLPDGYVAIDQNGEWVWPDFLNWGDDQLTFVQDPFDYSDWYEIPDFEWPSGAVPGPIAPAPALDGVGMPQDGTLPAPTIETPDGDVNVGAPTSGVRVRALPQRDQPPTDLQGVAAELSVPGAIIRGEVFTAMVTLRKYMVSYTINEGSVTSARAAYDSAVTTYRAAKLSGDFFAETAAANAIDAAIVAYQSAATYIKTIRFQDWTNVAGLSGVTLQLASNDLVQVITVNGDVATTQPADFGSATTFSVKGIVTGGTLDPNTCQMCVLVGFNDASRAPVYSDYEPVQIAALNLSVSYRLEPMSTILRGNSFQMKITAYYNNGNIAIAYNKQVDFTYAGSDPDDGFTPAMSPGGFVNGVLFVTMKIFGGTDTDVTFNIKAEEHGKPSVKGTYFGGFGNIFILEEIETDVELHRSADQLPSFGSSALIKISAPDKDYAPVVPLVVTMTAFAPNDTGMTAAYSGIQNTTLTPWSDGKPFEPGGVPQPIRVTGEYATVLAAIRDGGSFVIRVTDPATGRTGDTTITIIQPTSELEVSAVASNDSWWNYMIPFTVKCKHTKASSYSWNAAWNTFVNDNAGADPSTLTPTSDPGLALATWTQTLPAPSEAGATPATAVAGFAFNATTGIAAATFGVLFAPLGVTTGGDNEIILTCSITGLFNGKVTLSIWTKMSVAPGYFGADGADTMLHGGALFQPPFGLRPHFVGATGTKTMSLQATQMGFNGVWVQPGLTRYWQCIGGQPQPGSTPFTVPAFYDADPAHVCTVTPMQ